MATENTLPQTLACPIASEADQSDVNQIPVEPTPLSALASQKQGFPHLTMLPLTEGGECPYGEDFNGLFNLVSSHTFYLQNGGSYTFNPELSTILGGYAKNQILWYFPTNGLPVPVLSMIDNNTYNFAENPSFIDGRKWRYFIPDSNLDHLSTTGQAKFDAKANVSNTVTTDTVQTITASKNISVGGTQAYARTFEILMPTSTESNPTENKFREIAFISSEGAGERYEGSLTHQRLSNGTSYTGLRAGRLINGKYKESGIGVTINASGLVYGTAPTPPANSTGEEIVTAAWVRSNAGTPTGSIIIWSSSNPPAGYLICNGAAISRTTYSRLFQVIGTTWGAGDGSTTFNLPNLYLLSDIKVKGYTKLGLTTYSAPNVPSSALGMIYRSDEPAGASGPFVMFNQGVQNQGIGLTSDVNSTGLAYQKSTFPVTFCIRY